MKRVYLHLGQEVVVKIDTIVGIFDLEKSSLSKVSVLIELRMDVKKFSIRSSSESFLSFSPYSGSPN